MTDFCPIINGKCKGENCSLFIVLEYRENEGVVGRCAFAKIAVELESDNRVIR